MKKKMLDIKEKVLRGHKGIALFYTILIIGFMVTVSTSIMMITYRQAISSSYSSHTLAAFYASESALECGLYWDVKRNNFVPGTIDPLDPSIIIPNTSTLDPITCNGQSPSVSPDPSTGYSVLDFSFDNNAVGEVIIDKRNINVPSIEAIGYNSDDPNSSRRVARGINLTYNQNVVSGSDSFNDIILVMDVSGSVTSFLDTLKTAANIIVTNLEDDDGNSLIDPDKTRIGVVSFESRADIELSLSGDETAITNAINGLSTSGFTNLAGALILAEREFNTNGRNGPNPDDVANKFVVIITDGQPNRCSNPTGNNIPCHAAGYYGHPTQASQNQAADKATDLRNNGVTVMAVGVGVSSASATYMENDLVSSPPATPPPSSYYFDTDWSNLINLVQTQFQNIFSVGTRGGFERQAD